MLSRYLRERGDANIKSIRDLIDNDLPGPDQQGGSHDSFSLPKLISTLPRQAAASASGCGPASDRVAGHD